MKQAFNSQVIWIFIISLTIVLLYLLAPILTPFIFGGLLAYLCDPLVKKLDKRGWPHLVSVIAVFSMLILIFLLLILMIAPLIQKQILLFIESLPKIATWIEDTLIPWVKQSVNTTTLKQTLSSSLPKAGGLFGTILTSGYTIIEWTVNLVLTPIVTFYLLRDWDIVCDSFKKAFPKSIRPKAVKIARECDEILSAFFRGQLLVMVTLGAIYGIGLTLVGLRAGFIIGLLGGLLSIVPYLGSFFVVVTSSISSLIQYGDMTHLALVLGVFFIGQILEGYVLTPYFVGQRIGLHPVIVILAIMAGGSLFGFFGVLVALPAAALIKVLIRNFRESYQLN